jgi:hypothetical protein
LDLQIDSGIQTGCDVIRRGKNGEAGAQIVNRIEVSLPKFEGISLLGVSKQIRAECAAVLYSENNSHLLPAKVDLLTADTLINTMNSSVCPIAFPAIQNPMEISHILNRKINLPRL